MGFCLVSFEIALFYHMTEWASLEYLMIDFLANRDLKMLQEIPCEKSG